MISETYPIDNRGGDRNNLHVKDQSMSQPQHNTYTHTPGMPHTPGISYVNGVGYLDVGTAPSTVITRFNDFLRGFASLSHSLSHLLARESHLCRKYRFQSPADSRWLLPLTARDASGMNNELTDAVRRLDSLVVRQRLDSRAAALEELLLGDVGNPPEVLSNSIQDRMKYDQPTTSDITLDSHRLHGGIPLNITQVPQSNHNGSMAFRSQSVVEETRMVELPYSSTPDRLNIIGSSGGSNQNRIHTSEIQTRVVTTSGQPISIVENPVKIPVVSGKKKKFACHICGKEYNTKQYVKQHVKSIHKQADGKQPIVTIEPHTHQTKLTNNFNGQVGNGQDTQLIQKRFICHADGCGMKFTTSFLLQKHQRNVHGYSNHNSQQSHQIQNSQPQQSRTLVPTNRQTGSNGNPINPATGEEEVNMVECDICGKNVREQSLPAHKKRHELAEKRPFKCDICGKGFMRTVTLRDHMNTHNGVKPHKCRVCGRGWASRPNMLKHVREKHPEARIPMGESNNQQNGRVLAIEPPDKEEIDVKPDGRQQAIEYTDHHTIGEVRNIQVTQATGLTTIHQSQSQSADIQSILQNRSISGDSYGSRPPQHSQHLPMRLTNTTIVTQPSIGSIPMDHS